MESQTDIPISTIAEENPFETGVTAEHTFVFTQSPSSRYVGLLGVQSRIGSPPRSRTSCLMNKLKLPSSCSSLATSWTTETVLHRDSGHSDRIYWRIILCCVASVHSSRLEDLEIGTVDTGPSGEDENQGPNFLDPYPHLRRRLSGPRRSLLKTLFREESASDLVERPHHCCF